VASERWPATGLPPNPGGWITTTARNRAIDRLRRESSRHDRHAQAALVHELDEVHEAGPVRDDRLRLIFTCCHPALATNVQVALTLRLLGGLETGEIARLPRARGDGAAARQGQAQDPRRQHPLPDPRTPSSRTGCGRC
jgi:RNA polymerase sigma-70 factor (ECF subfamily)